MNSSALTLLRVTVALTLSLVNWSRTLPVGTSGRRKLPSGSTVAERLAPMTCTVRPANGDAAGRTVLGPPALAVLIDCDADVILPVMIAPVDEFPLGPIGDPLPLPQPAAISGTRHAHRIGSVRRTEPCIKRGSLKPGTFRNGRASANSAASRGSEDGLPFLVFGLR